MAEDIISLLDNLGWTGEREINVVGLSLGGMITQGGFVFRLCLYISDASRYLQNLHTVSLIAYALLYSP